MKTKSWSTNAHRRGSKNSQVYGGKKLYTKTKLFNFILGQTPKSSSQVLFKLRFFHDAINCCLRYSNMDYQDEIFKTNH